MCTSLTELVCGHFDLFNLGVWLSFGLLAAASFEYSPHGRRRRTRAERGLPEEQELVDLGAKYLEIQRRLWGPQPELGLAQTVVASDLAEHFRRRFLDLNWTPYEGIAPDLLKQVLGAAYVRYSCENSNPRSLVQQLENCLIRAHADNVFVPWEFVTADSAVSGTTARRRGYVMAKTVALKNDTKIFALYIDELGRAARTAIEMLILGQKISRRDIRLIGATDGFNSASENGKIMLMVHAMLHEWFVDQLRSKVYRGQKDAFFQGNVVRPPCFGYRLAKKLNEHGEPMINNKGLQVHTREIVEEAAELIKSAFILFADEGWSPDRIARRFNDLKADGKSTWDRQRITTVLRRTLYIGVEYDRIRRYEWDEDEQVNKRLFRPESEWWRRDVPDLRIVDDGLWQRAQERLADISAAFKKNADDEHDKGRTVAYPNMLIRPVCGSCGRPMWLGNSGPHRSLCCHNGIFGKNGCTLKGYKSVKIIEDCILGHVRDVLRRKEFVDEIVKRANKFIASEAALPQRDDEPVRREIDAVRSRLKNLERVLEDDGDEVMTVVRVIKSLEAKLKRLEAEAASITHRNQPVPPPLDPASVELLLKDLVELLNSDVAIAAPAIRKMVGTVTVSTREVEGRKKPEWFAEFSIDAVPMLVELSRRKNLPTMGTVEYLDTRNWKFGATADLALKKVPHFQRMAETCQRLHREGVPMNLISRETSLAPKVIRKILASDDVPLSVYGGREKPKSRRRSKEGYKVKVPLYKRFGNEIAELREKHEMTLVEIIDYLAKEYDVKISIGTAMRGHDWARPDRVKEAISTGQYESVIGISQRRQELRIKIRELVQAHPNMKRSRLASLAQCSRTTVTKILAEMANESSGDKTKGLPATGGPILPFPDDDES